MELEISVRDVLGLRALTYVKNTSSLETVTAVAQDIFAVGLSKRGLVKVPLAAPFPVRVWKISMCILFEEVYIKLHELEELLNIF